MTTVRRQAEADRVEVAYYWALSEIGAQTIEEAIALWHNEVPVGEAASTSSKWLDRAIHLILTRRGRSREIALAYYRLVRALRTGKTVADPRRPEPTYVSLEMLRREFELLLDDVEAQAPREAPQEPQNRPETDEQVDNDPTLTPEVQEALEALDEDDSVDDDRVLVEELRELEALIEQEDADAEAEAEQILQAIADQKLQRQLQELDAEQRAADYLEQQSELARKAAAATAVQIERIVLNAARGLVYDLSTVDESVIGWARYSETGTPCGWCAMLISRGVVYKTRQQAGSSRDEHGEEVEDTDRYHPNCHCVAVPIWDIAQFDGNPLFDQNRYFEALWREQMLDAQGRPKYEREEALTVWRKFLRELAAEQNQTTAQEAA